MKRLLLLIIFAVSLSFAAQQPDDGRPKQAGSAQEAEEKSREESAIGMGGEFLPPQGIAGYVGALDWNITFDEGKVVKEIARGPYDPKVLQVFATSGDGRFMALGQKASVSAYDMQDLNKKLKTIMIPHRKKGKSFELEAIALSNNGLLGYIAVHKEIYGTESGSTFTDITLYAGAIHVENGKKMYSSEEYNLADGDKFALAFSPAGDHLMAHWNSFPNKSVVIDVETNKPIQNAEDLPLSIGRVHYSANGDFRSRAIPDRRHDFKDNVVFEQKKDGKWFAYGTSIDFSAIPSYLFCKKLALSEDGSRVAAILQVKSDENNSEDLIAVYNTQTGELIASLQRSIYFPGKNISAVALSPSGNQLMWQELDFAARKVAVKVCDLDYIGMPPLEDAPEEE